jgi:hypothetical protein
VGELRAMDDTQLGSLRSIGRSSVQEIHHYAGRCAALEAGKQHFFRLQEVFDLLLNGEEMEVLRGRYGFMRRDGRIDTKYMTLQEIGNQFRLTRERIRQVEHSALSQLRSRLGQAYLAPFYKYLIAFIQHQDGVASADEVAQLKDQFWIGEDDPGAVMLLLHDVDARHYTWHRGLFSTLGADELDAIESRAIDFIRQTPGPVHVDAIVAALTTMGPAAITRLLQQSDVVIMTRDHRCLIEASGADAFLAELAATSSETSLHYRDLTRRYNERVWTHSARGSGFILRILNQSSRFEKQGRGQYTLTRS